MATCKDCYKNDVCNIIKNIGEMQDYAENLCNSFVDKSKIKEFPCDVGDTVYSILDDYKVLPFIDVGKVFALGIDENSTIWISVMYESGLKMYYTPKNMGKSFYLTIEEAEKALKELK